MAFLDDLAVRLVAQGVHLNPAATILNGSKANIPAAGSGVIISLIETGGSGPTRVHNKAGANTKRPSAQIVTRGDSYQAARDKAEQAYAALDGVFNATINSVSYLSIVALQEPTDIGSDDVGRPRVAFNVLVEKATP